MKKKPWLLNLYTIFFVSVAISFPLQIMSIYGHGASESQMIFNKMTYLNWAVIGCCLVNAALSFNGHWLLKASLPLSFFVVAFNNFFVSKLAHDYSPLMTTLATFAFGVIGTYLFFSEAKEILDNPTKRWWLAPPRHKRTLPVWIQGPLGSPILSKTFDISRSGAFLSAPALALLRSDLTNPINKGDEISLTLGLSGQKEFSCQAEVVRLTEPNGNYPGGIGIRFKEMSMTNKWVLDQILRDSISPSTI